MRWRFVACAVALSACDVIDPGNGLAFPLDSWQVIQGFGSWNPNWGGYHLAVDVVADPGTPVYAIGQGTVRAVFTHNQATGYGALVLIEHEIGGAVVTSLHGHLSSALGVPVAPGDRVNRGDVIGYIAADDEDGGPWNPHLHFGIRRGPVDLAATLCGEWLYVGYTRGCAATSHDEARDAWYDPAAFLEAHSGG
jgi:murein DD-endopeptidase MepM/ murein hydrolase activator NlpD